MEVVEFGEFFWKGMGDRDGDWGKGERRGKGKRELGEG